MEKLHFTTYNEIGSNKAQFWPTINENARVFLLPWHESRFAFLFCAIEVDPPLLDVISSPLLVIFTFSFQCSLWVIKMHFENHISPQK